MRLLVMMGIKEIPLILCPSSHVSASATEAVFFRLSLFKLPFLVNFLQYIRRNNISKGSSSFFYVFLRFIFLLFELFHCKRRY